MKLVVGVATVNRKDLLLECLEDISINLSEGIEKLIILDNGHQNITEIPENLKDKLHIEAEPENRGCGGSWSKILDLGYFRYGADHVLIISDDVVLGKSYKDIKKVINDRPDYNIIVSSFHWSVVLISKECFTKVGYFDPQFFPAYYEDNDYHIRVQRYFTNEDNPHDGYYATDEILPTVCRNSMSIKVDNSLSKGSENKKKFDAKWGTLAGGDGYQWPYNSKHLGKEFDYRIDYRHYDTGVEESPLRKDPVIPIPKGQDKKIACIVLNYKTGPMTDALVDWLKNVETYKNKDIYVINNSEDPTCSSATHTLPENLKFTNGMTAGLEIAQKEGDYDAYYFVCSDIEFNQGNNVLENLVRVMFSSNDIGVVSPQVNSFLGDHMAVAAGDFDERIWLEVTATLYRKETIDKIGFWDTNLTYGFGIEFDYGFRVRLDGEFRQILTNSCTIHHKQQQSHGEFKKNMGHDFVPAASAECEKYLCEKYDSPVWPPDCLVNEEYDLEAHKDREKENAKK